MSAPSTTSAALASTVGAVAEMLGGEPLEMR
jgi:hypothetical protein